MTTTPLEPQVQDILMALSKRISRIDAAVEDLASESGLAFSSVEADDGSFDTYAADGTLFSAIDAENGFLVSETVYGPAKPEQPDVAAGFNSLIVSYDGTFLDGDWEENQIDHVEIHATATNTDALDDQNQVGTFTSSNGGVFTYPWNALDGGRWIWLQAVTVAGEEGTPSDPVFAVPDVVAPTDGVAPTTSPAVTVRGTVKSVWATWTATANADPVTYDIYARNGSAPTSTSTYFIASTPGTSIVINYLTGGVAIDSSMDIYVMVVARDADGRGPDGATGHAVPITINTVDITGLAITNGKVATGAIATANIQNLAISTALIADNAVIAAKITDGTITTAKIGGLQITAPLIADATITTAKYGAGSVTNTVIGDDSVTSAKIVANTIVAADIAALTITASQIAALTITAAQIAANTITATQIAANTITAGQIAAGTITANKLSIIVGGGNLLTDSSFETGNVWGVQTAATITSDTTRFYQGARSMKVVVTNGSAFRGAWSNNALASTQVAGGPYTVSAWVYPTTAMNLRIVFFDNAGQAPETTTTCPANTWTRISATGTVVASANPWSISIDTGAGAQSGTFYVDAVQFERGDVATSYSPKPDEILPGTIVASMIAATTITAAQIAALTITAAQIATGTITATQIAAGTLTATEIAAGAITANKLLVTMGGGNIVPNSGFEAWSAGLPVNWVKAANATVTQVAGWTGGSAARLTTTNVVNDGTRGTLATANIILPSVLYTITFYARRNLGTGDLRIGCDGWGFPLYTAVLTGNWARYTFTGTSSAGANPYIYFLPTVSGDQVDIDRVQIELGDVATAYAPKGDEILPGTVVATMVSTDTLTANEIATNAITTLEIASTTIIAGDIASTTITAAQIAGTTITATQIAATTITAAQIAGTTITATQIASRTITALQIAATTITANEIAAGTITATQIQVGSITADRVVIGDATNVVRDPSASNLGTWVGMGASGGAGWSVVTVGTAAPNDINNQVFRYNANNTYSQVNEPSFAVRPGDIYTMSFYRRSQPTVAGTGNIGVFLFFYDKTGASISQVGFDLPNTSYPTSFTATGTNPGFVSGTITVPANAATAGVTMRATAGITGGLYDFDNIQVSRQITGDLLVNGAINGQTITGATIQTATGLGTTAGIAGMQFSNDLSGGVQRFYSGLGSVGQPETPGMINPNISGGMPFIDIRAPFGGIGTGGATDTSAWTKLSIQTGGVIGGSITANNQVQITGPGTNPADLWVDGWITCGVQLHGGTGVFDDSLVGASTTGASINTNGRVIRTSTAQMKEAVKPMTTKESHSVLGLESYTARYKPDEGEQRDPRRYPVFIAEQGAEVGAELWVARQHKVEWDEDDRNPSRRKRKIVRDKNGPIVAFRTADITVAHNALIKELFERIEQLEAAR